VPYRDEPRPLFDARMMIHGSLSAILVGLGVMPSAAREDSASTRRVTGLRFRLYLFWRQCMGRSLVCSSEATHMEGLHGPIPS
jgi:hypothetical protein